MATDYIILAGGCFWGVEQLFVELPGVLDTEVGYTGGELANPKYEEVKTGKTGHAESIRVEYDPSVISLSDILHFFFKIHDPTTVDRQGNDIGSQYRSAIFVRDDSQREIARTVIDEVNKLGRWAAPIATRIEAEKEFFDAEEYHQDYLKKNPGGYTCHFVRE